MKKIIVGISLITFVLFVYTANANNFQQDKNKTAVTVTEKKATKDATPKCCAGDKKADAKCCKGDVKSCKGETKTDAKCDKTKSDCSKKCSGAKK
jgi:hypothetical protein